MRSTPSPLLGSTRLTRSMGALAGSHLRRGRYWVPMRAMWCLCAPQQGPMSSRFCRCDTRASLSSPHIKAPPLFLVISRAHLYRCHVCCLLLVDHTPMAAVFDAYY